MHSRSKSSLKKGSQRSKDRPCSSPTRGRESRQAISEDSSDETECSLSFPVLKPVDKSKRLPCYSAGTGVHSFEVNVFDVFYYLRCFVEVNCLGIRGNRIAWC